MRAIILAAGQSLSLDGFNKLLIKDPKTHKTLLDNYIDIFGVDNVVIVVGYKAIEVMSQYPQLNYIYNDDWAVTNNSGSLAMIDNIQPSFVLSSDFFINKSLIEKMRLGGDNILLTAHRESRGITSINCSTSSNRINGVYNGNVQKLTDPECLGIFKITDINLMSTWIKECRKNSHRFVVENINFGGEVPIEQFDLANELFLEINDVKDYIALIEERKPNE